MVEVRIGVGGAAGAGALAGWLRRDPGVAGSGAEIGLAPGSRSGEPSGAMGGLDTVTALADSAVALTSLLVSVAAWRRPVGARPPTVRVVESDGAVVEGTADEVLRVLRARGERGGPPAPAAHQGQPPAQVRTPEQGRTSEQERTPEQGGV
ncbi:hypothetical protein [Streptomyces sp. NPDC048172]|uniref:effector-associated constant component EACC1 n=1 Tax=Streptomyces sp. NPDC048172 TaxID=3365505 RepID=UPI003719E466